MSPELAELQRQVSLLARELGQTRRELFAAKRMIDLIRPHLFQEDDSGTGIGGIFAVTVIRSGGTAGDNTNRCSFTYNVSDLSGGALASAVTLTGNGTRMVNAAMTAGTRGIACYSASGALQLLWVDERITQTNCS